MSTRMHFCPGMASERLAQLATESGKPKAVILRTLIESAPKQEDAAFGEVYEFFTDMGLRIKEAYLSGKYERVVEIALSVREKGYGLPEIAVGAVGIIDSLSEIRGAQGCSMSFRPMDQREKLERLSAQGGLSMSVILRCLIMGVQLPSKIEMKVCSRLSQLGSYIKHIAYSAKTVFGDWRKLAACGNAICGIALQKGKSLNSRYLNSEILETDKD